MQGDISDQSCCSYLYSEVFSKKCCCAWLDNREIFRSTHKKSIYNLIFFSKNIYIYIIYFIKLIKDFIDGEIKVWSCNGCKYGFSC